MTSRLRLTWIAAVALAVVIPFGAAAQNASVGDLTPLACIGSAGTNTCPSSANMAGAFGIAVTPSGGNVYVAANGVNAVEELSRAGDGKLTHVGCIADATNGPGNCDRAPGLLGATGVAVSPDGKNVYVASAGSNALGVFNRATDGTLNAAGCIGAAGANPANCATTANLKRVVSVVISPDGKSAYAAASDSNAIETFVRSSSGALTPSGCLGNPVAPLGPSNCNGVAGLEGPQDLAISPDGKNLYVAAARALVILNRNPADGSLTDGGCVAATVSGPVGCAPKGEVNAGQSVAVSADGKNVYVASLGLSAVTTFNRAANGALVEAGCMADAATGPSTCTGVAGLHDPEGVAVSPDGANVYAAAAGSNDVKVLLRGGDGTLGNVDCIGQNGSDRPDCSPNGKLTGAMKVVVSPDGKNVYATIAGTLQEFTRATPASTPATTTTTTTTTPKTTTSTLNVRLVYATAVKTKTGRRSLAIRIRVQRAATADVKLLGRGGSVLLEKTFTLKGGGNTLSAALGSSVTAGTHQVVIALRDAAGNVKNVKATVLVPR